MTYTEEQLSNLSSLIFWMREGERERSAHNLHKDLEYLKDCEAKVEHYHNELREFLELAVIDETVWLKQQSQSKEGRREHE